MTNSLLSRLRTAFARGLTESFEAGGWRAALPIAAPFIAGIVLAGCVWLVSTVLGSFQSTTPAHGFVPPAYTCLEQKMLQSDLKVGVAFSQGIYSDAPRPWARVPTRGLFAFGNQDLQSDATAAVELMKNAHYDEGAETLRHMDGRYKKSIFGARKVDAPDRVLIEYHLGLADLKGSRQDFTSAAAHFGAGLSALGESSGEPVGKTGVRIALLEGLAQTQSPRDGVATIKDAIAKAKTSSTLLATEGTSKDLVFRFNDDAIADLGLDELYADGLAMNIRWLAAAACGKESEDASKSLLGFLTIFQASPGAAQASPQLQADLILAATLVGDTEFLKHAQAPQQALSKNIADGVSLALQLYPAGAPDQSDAPDQEDAGPTAGTADPLQQYWHKFASARGYFSAGDRAHLASAISQPADHRRQHQQWAGEIIDTAAGSSDERARIWQEYGGFAPGDLRAKTHPLTSLIELGAMLALILAGGLGSLLLSQVRVAYRQLYTSSHAADRATKEPKRA